MHRSYSDISAAARDSLKDKSKMASCSYLISIRVKSSQDYSLSHQESFFENEISTSVLILESARACNICTPAEPGERSVENPVKSN